MQIILEKIIISAILSLIYQVKWSFTVGTLFFRNGKVRDIPADVLWIGNEFWQAAVSLYGGQLLQAVHRSSGKDVIYLGEKAVFSSGNSIRGGVPVCWPWFGASAVEGRPIQGFARTARWESVLAGKDFIRLKLPCSAVPAELVDFPFELFSETTVGESLEVALTMKNCSPEPVEISCALHTYLAVSDCEKITVNGVENTPFTIKGGPEQPAEKEPLKIQGEICRLYFPQTSEIVLTDTEWGRKISIVKENSRSTLIWNPGAERCRQIADLEQEEFHNFVCVECNRAGADTLLLMPGTEYRITQKINVGSL